MEIRPNNSIQPVGVYFIFNISFVIHHVNIQCSNVSFISLYDFHWHVTIFECNILCMILDKFIVMPHRWHDDLFVYVQHSPFNVSSEPCVCVSVD